MKWFYDFEELAAEWQVSEKFLLELGILEPDHMRLHFSVKTANGLIALSQRDIYQLLMSRDRAIYVIAKNILAFPSGRILVDRKSLAVEWEEVNRIEEKYPLKQPPVISGGESRQPNSPGPEEVSLVGKPNIAKYLGKKYLGGTCSVSSVRDWMKKKSLPLPHNKPLNGRVVSYPSWLDEWWKKRTLKK